MRSRTPRFSASVIGRAIVIVSALAMAACTATTDGAGNDVGRGGGRDTGGGGRDVGGNTDTGNPADTGDPTDTGNPSDTGGQGDTEPDTGNPNDSGNPSDTGNLPDLRPSDSGDPACFEFTAAGELVPLPVDIVWVIDTSGSMTEETMLVQQNLNTFAEFIADSGIDYRVAMLAGDTVCIPPPLSSATMTMPCPDIDTPNLYRHVRTIINSHDALEELHGNWPTIAAGNFIRPNSIVHFVVVSDDEATGFTAGDFYTGMQARDPRFTNYDLWQFHSIVSLDECGGGFPPIGCGCSGPHGEAEAQGLNYMNLSLTTDGVASSICDPDWGPIFDAIGDNVVESANIPCTFLIPDPGEGLDVDYSQVRVLFSPDGVSQAEAPHVENRGACTGTGWFYDDNDNPSTINICPGACGAIPGEVEIELGCVKAG